jgi:hypothetical protein
MTSLSTSVSTARPLAPTIGRKLEVTHNSQVDDARHGFRLTDATYNLPPVSISRREAFSFGLTRKLLVYYEGIVLFTAARAATPSRSETAGRVERVDSRCVGHQRRR